MDLSCGMNGHFVHTSDVINDIQIQDCISLLNLDIEDKSKMLQYEINDYKKLITNNYYYVDKTKYLINLEGREWCNLNVAPIGVGKSLFLSMMYYYLDINSKDKFSMLFKDTYIYNYVYRCNNSYYVLKFDFNIKANTYNEILNSIKNEVIKQIEYFISYYNIDYKIKVDNFISILDDFLKFCTDSNYRICVMIDNYDTIMLNLFLNNKKSLMNKLYGVGSVMSEIYAVLKAHRDIIYKLYITGSTTLGMDSIRRNSGLDLMLFDDVSNIFDFTYEDVDNIFKYFNKENIYKNIEEKEYLLFNSSVVLSYLHNNSGLINNIDNYNKVIKRVKFKTKEEYNNFINECLEVKIRQQLYTRDLDFSFKEEFTYNEIALLLYYFGYLTINDDRSRFVVSSDVLKKED